MLILFWTSVAVLAWVAIGYPAFAFTRGWLLARTYHTNAASPLVSVVVAAYNEAEAIGERIENLLSLDYPQDRLQIVVASDGSTDETVEIAKAFEDRGVLVLDLPRQGKIPAVNTAMQRITGDIVVMTDANSHFPSQTVQALVRPFADKTVGGVAGNQIYSNDKHLVSGDGEQLYWNLDRRLKQALSRSWSVVSATGAVYAIRRSLVQAIPPAVTDDFFTSTGVIAAGKRLVFAPDAIAVEPVAEKSTAEFARKVRVMTRGFRALWERRALFNPFRTGLYAVDLLTYKLLKRLIVIPLLTLFVSSGLLAVHSRLFGVVFAVQALGYTVALLGYFLAGTRLGQTRPIALMAYVGMVNIAAVWAMLNCMIGRKIDRWEPQRPEATLPGDATRMEVV